MKLSGQAERGYAMAALLVGMSVMAVLMTVVMPVWKQMAQREKEDELVFRGQQYTRALSLFQRKTGPGVLPPNVDVLVSQHFLRRKFKDPITGDDFLLIPGALAPGSQAQLQVVQSLVQTLGASSSRGSTLSSTGSTGSTGGYVAQGGPLGTNVSGGVTGVVSKSTATSIRIYNGRTHYNEWEFRYIAPAPPPNAGNGGRGGTPQRGQPPAQGGPGGGLGGVSGRGSPPDGRGGPIDGRGRGAGTGDGRGGPAGPPGQIDSRGGRGFTTVPPAAGPTPRR